MKTLIVEDDATSRLLLHTILREWGECHVASDGKQALTAFLAAQQAKQPYQLICLDIMMPEIDGKEVLGTIRGLETASGRVPEVWTKIVMTTALGDPATIGSAFNGLCDSYLVKPIDKPRLLACLRQLNLIDFAVSPC
jgi:two-component system chemotaxis response regulator CheY